MACKVNYSVFTTSSIGINADIPWLETQHGKENAFAFLGETVCEHWLNITYSILLKRNNNTDKKSYIVDFELALGFVLFL